MLLAGWPVCELGLVGKLCLGRVVRERELCTAVWQFSSTPRATRGDKATRGFRPDGARVFHSRPGA
jgi:hypothetical protein